MSDVWVAGGAGFNEARFDDPDKGLPAGYLAGPSRVLPVLSVLF
jgi:hypothetical protein